MKWNCNIVKEMYDRVIRRKFGLLCSDDTSNKNFINAYLNTLDCNPINLQCLSGEELPCQESSTGIVTVCNLIVTVTYIIQVVEGQVQYVFTATPANGTAPYNYNWDWDYLNHWDYISGPLRETPTEGGNILVLTPKQLSTTVDTDVSLVVTDVSICTNTTTTNVIYLGGCTDSEAVNYNFDATFDNGTCYYDALVMSLSLECNVDDSANLCITATGGTPPYTVVGLVNGVIATDGGTLCGTLPNATAFSNYIVDSVGVVTPIQAGVVDCPFDCMLVTIIDNEEVICITDGLGNNTGEATLTLTPSGGNAPYTVEGTINGGVVGPFQDLGGGVWGPGQTVMDTDIVTGTITDVNGCTTAFSITIDCPVPAPGVGTPTCEDLEGLNILIGLQVLSVNRVSPFSSLYTVVYKFNYQFTNLGTFGLTIGNVVIAQATLTNTTPSLLGHYKPYPSTACNPCINNITPIYLSGSSDKYTAILFDPCGDKAVLSFPVSATVKLQVTVVTGETSCVLCFTENIIAYWNCLGEASVGTNTNMDNVPC